MTAQRASIAELHPTRDLARWSSGLTHADITDTARTWARHAILDWFGVTIAGAREPLAAILTEEFAGGGNARATLVALNNTAAVHDAALVNGAVSHALDFDDVNRHMHGHPTVPVASAVLALGEVLGSSGRDIVLAFIAGYEVECRLGDMCGDAHYDKGFHATGTFGTFGAAAGAARLMGLDAEQTAAALGIAASQASGLKLNFGTMIVEEPLAFPEGKAAAEVLKAGENPGPGLKILALASTVGAIVKLAAESGLRMIPDNAVGAGFFGKFLGYMGTGLSPALLGVGYIVGLNVGIVVLSGSILSYNIAIPIYHAFFQSTDPVLAGKLVGLSAFDAAQLIRGEKVRYLGVGTMLIGGVWTLFSLRKSLFSGVKSGFAAARKGTGEAVAETERDLPMKWMLVALVAFVIPLAFLYQAIVGQWSVSIPMTIIMIVAGFLFVSVSAYLAGLVGSSNNPVSGITIATILFASVVLMFLLGRDSPIGAVAAIMIGAVVCCAAAVGGDNLQDLKAGYLVGATPWKQQLMLGIGAFSCALVMAPVLNLLATAYGIGPATPEHPQSLNAPQATLMASVAKGMFGGELPWGMIGIGAGIGVVVIALDEWLKSRNSNFRVPVLAAAIGIYLPLELMVPIFLGGLLSHLVERKHGVHPHDETARDRIHRPGMLFSAGLITGEALMGIAIAVPIVLSGQGDVLALPDAWHFSQYVGLVVLAFVGWLLYRSATRIDTTAAPIESGLK